MLSSLAMALALLAQDGQATLQSCVLEASGWVCRYRVPDGAQPVAPELPAVSGPAGPKPKAAESPGEAEAARQARLLRRCAGASWLSLCTPADRREAKALQEAAVAKATLRREATTLVGDGRCPEAVRAALQGGDLALAREIREFCAADK